MKDKKIEWGETEKKIQFHKSSQIKQIILKRIETKCKRITNWRVAFKFCRVSVEIKKAKGKKEKQERTACVKPEIRLEHSSH